MLIEGILASTLTLLRDVEDIVLSLQCKSIDDQVVDL